MLRRVPHRNRVLLEGTKSGTAYLSFAICYLSFGLKGRRLSLARIVELRLNAVCANHFQIVHEIDAI